MRNVHTSNLVLPPLLAHILRKSICSTAHVRAAYRMCEHRSKQSMLSLKSAVLADVSTLNSMELVSIQFTFVMSINLQAEYFCARLFCCEMPCKPLMLSTHRTFVNGAGNFGWQIRRFLSRSELYKPAKLRIGGNVV